MQRLIFNQEPGTRELYYLAGPLSEALQSFDEINLTFKTYLISHPYDNKYSSSLTSFLCHQSYRQEIKARAVSGTPVDLILYDIILLCFLML